MNADAYQRFAAELSNNLHAVGTILDEHPVAGPCTGCRPPSSRPSIPAPCSLRHVATLALEIRTERERRAADAVTAPTEPLPVVAAGRAVAS